MEVSHAGKGVMIQDRQEYHFTLDAPWSITAQFHAGAKKFHVNNPLWSFMVSSQVSVT